jgi:hypothetical protein
MAARQFGCNAVTDSALGVHGQAAAFGVIPLLLQRCQWQVEHYCVTNSEIQWMIVVRACSCFKLVAYHL